jgi:hypothetical protein
MLRLLLRVPPPEDPAALRELNYAERRYAPAVLCRAAASAPAATRTEQCGAGKCWILCAVGGEVWHY